MATILRASLGYRRGVGHLLTGTQPHYQSAQPFGALSFLHTSHTSHRQQSFIRLAADASHASVDDWLSQVDLDAIAPPEIDEDLGSYQREAGALFIGPGPPVSFGNDDAAEDALMTGAVIVDRSFSALHDAAQREQVCFDRSDCVRLRVSGPGFRQFLHNMTTNAITDLQAGQGCETVVVTAQARCLDLAVCLMQSSSAILLLHPSARTTVLPHLEKYILDPKEVSISDISSRCCQFVVAGTGAGQVMQALGAAEALHAKPLGSHVLLSVKGRPVSVAVGSGLGEQASGFTVVCDEAVAGDLWLASVQQGCIPMGSSAWERQRILQGHPAAGSELTLEYNPLEANLQRAVSLQKGCYMGQETLAKVANKSAVKQQLVGLQLDSVVAPGTVVELDGSRVGLVTSCTEGEDSEGGWGLGYVKSRALQGDVPVRMCAGGVGCVVMQLQPGVVAQGINEGEEEEVADAEAERAQRMAAMQARLAAWQQQQQ